MNRVIELDDEEAMTFYDVQAYLNDENLEKFILPIKKNNTILKLNFNEESWKNTKYWDIFKNNELFRNEFYKKYYKNKYYNIIDELKNKKLVLYKNIMSKKYGQIFNIIEIILFRDTILVLIENNKIEFMDYDNIPINSIKNDNIYFTDDMYIHVTSGNIIIF